VITTGSPVSAFLMHSANSALAFAADTVVAAGLPS
jgi:hypothetical protein